MSVENDNKATTIKSNDPRKATEIVLSIEDKLFTLIKQMYSYDLNLKLVLDRTNKIYKYIERLEESERQMLEEASKNDEATSTTDPRIINVQAGERIEEAKDFSGQRRTSRVNAPPAPAAKSVVRPNVMPRQSFSEAIKQHTEAKAQPAVNPEPLMEQHIPKEEQVPQQITDRKIPVTQRITDDKGHDVFMAEITITGSDKQVAAKTKTNALGKWQAQLRPGKYVVNLVKTDTATKNKTEINQNVEVPKSNGPVTLPVAIIKR